MNATVENSNDKYNYIICFAVVRVSNIFRLNICMTLFDIIPNLIITNILIIKIIMMTITLYNSSFVCYYKDYQYEHNSY